MISLTLGDLTFQGFEVAGHIGFGGSQKLAVHKLLGGSRVVDSLGRDDAPLSWSGVLSGAGAADRARTLDAQRVAGLPQTLSWDAFCYSVIIRQLCLDFCNSWWIPYQITCLVQRDLAEGSVEVRQSTITAVISDLSIAVSALSPTMSTLPAQVSSLISHGPSGQAQAKVDVAQALAATEQMITGLELSLESKDLNQLVASSGTLSSLCYARGFLERSNTNINELDE